MANMMIPALPGLYWGYRRILNRVGYPNGGYRTFLKLVDKTQLPVYQLPRRHQMVWALDEALLQIWQIEMVKRSGKRLRKRLL